ncbi:MAG: response regulator [Deltaproteobacteria bacterium]|jgi:putative two-component system response regulator|nr:response regulator [Deltaproteobacteria bacterium]
MTTGMTAERNQPPRILVVDDNLSNLAYIGAQISDGHEVMLAKSGPQALLMAAKKPPDLILLDVDMPGMDGFETMGRLRDNAALSRVPVIYLTASHDPETELRALDSGAKDFVTKPFRRDILLHRINLHLRMARYNSLLEETVRELEDSLVSSFSGLIECRDGDTGGHVQRTKKYVALLGGLALDKGLFAGSLSRRELELMARAAPLHDIGKVGISDHILLKEGRFAEDEYEVMKTHTTVGADIIEHMFRRAPTQLYLVYAKKIALSHHEKYDGGGYPEGLAGDRIPLCSRIMAVADVYDALVEDRVYRPALAHDSAVDIIRAGRGSAFDPDLTDVFVAHHDLFSPRKIH